MRRLPDVSSMERVQVAARVLHASGVVRVTPKGAPPFTANAETELVRSDTVLPDDGAFALVLLKNGYVVRIDDLGPLPVGDIIAIDQAPTMRPVTEQVLALLNDTERGVAPTVESRAAGWRHMRRASEAPGSRNEPKPAAAPPPPKAKESTSESAERDQRPGGGARVDVVPEMALEPSGAATMPSASDTATMGRAGVTAAAAKAATPAPLAPVLAKLVRGCVEDTLLGAALRGGTAVSVTLVVKGGVITRVALPRGAPPGPTCARLVKTAAGVLIVELR
jgi:hypothetical protein